MVRRLARREGSPPHESLFLEEIRPTPQQPTTPRSRRKKRPAIGDIAAIAKAWLDRWPPSNLTHQIAKELTTAAGHLSPRQLNPFITNAILARWSKHLAPWTVYLRRCTLKTLLRQLETYGAPELATQLPKVRRPQPRTRVATPDELHKLTVAANPWMRLFILLTWQTALRFSEAMDVCPYNTREGITTVRVKGGAFRSIPLTPAIADLLAVANTEAREHESYIAILHGKPIGKPGVAAAWRNLCKKLHIEGLHPHDLRRTTSTALYEATHDIRASQQYLGHKNLASTVHYLAPLTETQLREYQQLLNFHSETKQ